MKYLKIYGLILLFMTLSCSRTQVKCDCDNNGSQARTSRNCKANWRFGKGKRTRRGPQSTQLMTAAPEDFSTYFQDLRSYRNTEGPVFIPSPLGNNVHGVYITSGNISKQLGITIENDSNSIYQGTVEGLYLMPYTFVNDQGKTVISFLLGKVLEGDKVTPNGPVQNVLYVQHDQLYNHFSPCPTDCKIYTPQLYVAGSNPNLYVNDLSNFFVQ